MATIPWSDREVSLALANPTYGLYTEACDIARIPARSSSAWRSTRLRYYDQKRENPDYERPAVPWVDATRETGPDDHSPPTNSGKPRTSKDWERTLSFLESDDDDAPDLRIEGISRDFPERKPIGLAYFSDLHIGARIQYKRLYADLCVLRDVDGLFGIINGDVLENTKVSLKSATALYTARISSPKKQLMEAEHFLRVANHKLLLITQGNHDAFDYRVAGVDRLEGLAHALNVPYVSERGGTLKITVGGVSYLVIAKHDYAGKSRITKSNSARRLWDEFPREWLNADVIALAHLHEPDLHHTTRKGRSVVYLRSGTYKTDDDWAEGAGYLPAYGVPVTIFYPDTRKIVPFTGELFEDAVRFLISERKRIG